MLDKIGKAGHTQSLNQHASLKIGNMPFALYLFYILWIINVEWINYVLSLVNIHLLSNNMVEVLAFLLLLGLILRYRKYYSFESISLSWDFYIGLLIILVYGFLVSAYPDRGYDTYNYHIIAQSPRFRNYFDSNNFGYGQFQVWGFRLGDRLFYYFRYLLGFRMGTILNTIVLAIAYMQIYQLFDIICKCRKKNLYIRICTCKTIWAIVILFYTQSLLMFASYYVDAMAIPVGLEVLRLLITNAKSKATSSDITYFALLNGICIGFKLTNIVYVIPCALVFLFFHYREIKARDWLAIVLVGLYPFAVYLVYNFACTGNPVFPYYNAVFKSPYFPHMNFKDSNWGGINVWQKLFWILYAAFRPEYRQSELCEPIYPVVLIAGLAGVSFMIAHALFYKVKRKQKVPNDSMAALVKVTLISSLLWAFTTGYSRYFILGRILWGLVAYCFIIALLNRFQRMGSIISGITITLAVACLGCNIKSSFVDGINWSWTAWKKETFEKQLDYIFKDKILTATSMDDVDLFFLTDQISQGIVELLGGEIPLVNSSYAGLAKAEYQSALEEHLFAENHIVDLHKRVFNDIAEYATILNNRGFLATKFEAMDTYLGSYEIISVEPIANQENTYWVSGGDAYKITVDAESRNADLFFIAGRYYDWKMSDPITLKFYAVNGREERELSAIVVDNVVIDNYSIPLELNVGETQLIIRAYQSNGEPFSQEEINKVFILNAIIE